MVDWALKPNYLAIPLLISAWNTKELAFGWAQFTGCSIMCCSYFQDIFYFYFLMADQTWVIVTEVGEYVPFCRWSDQAVARNHAGSQEPDRCWKVTAVCPFCVTADSHSGLEIMLCGDLRRNSLLQLTDCNLVDYGCHPRLVLARGWCTYTLLFSWQLLSLRFFVDFHDGYDLFIPLSLSFSLVGKSDFGVWKENQT